MRKLILKMQISVDGFVGGPNGEVDWVFKSLDQAATDWIVAGIWQAGVHIMGRRTFFDMAAYWPYSTEPYAPPMNEIPKLVFSRHGLDAVRQAELTRAFEDAARQRALLGVDPMPANEAVAKAWAETPVLTGDLAIEIKRLKQEPGKDIVAHGGASFARSLVKEALIDEYQLIVHPIALGKGLPLFSDLPAPLDLKLVSSTPLDTGAVAQVYRPVL
jgi:dihydrofolate reductase